MIKALLLCVIFAAAFADKSWLGNWFVIRQVSAYLDKCDIPKNLTMAHINYDNDTLVLSGTSAYNQAPKNWTLGWNATNQGGDTCSADNSCVSGYIVVLQGIPYANISWNLPDHPYGSLWCSSLFVPVPGEAEDSEDGSANVTNPELKDETASEEIQRLSQELFGSEPWFFVRSQESKGEDQFLSK